MATGNEIIVSSEPRGRLTEGIIDGTPKPGTCMQVKAGVPMVGGRFTYEAFNRDADGNLGTVWVLLPDHLQGKLTTDAYVSGARGFLYAPAHGEELNMLVANIAGTADDHAIGDQLMIDDGTGKLIATTGSPESEPFRLLEAITDPTVDTLALCEYTGH